MSRSGYIDDSEDWQRIRWRGQVASATRGKRGQRLLRDLLSALDAMPEKSLVASELETRDGDVCTLGALGKVRGIDMSKIDPEEPEQVAAAFDIAEPLAREIVYMNDEYYHGIWNESTKRYDAITPEQRWTKMRAWVAAQITAPEASGQVPAPQGKEGETK